MRLTRLLTGLVLLSAVTACAAKAPPTAPAIDLTARLAAAEALVRAGCFDCLREALQQYQILRTVTGAPAPQLEHATAGAFRAAALLGLRQRELGMADDGYLVTAKELLAAGACGGTQPTCESLSQLLDITSLALASGSTVSRTATSDALLADVQRFNRNRAEYGVVIRDVAARDVFAAYGWLAFACSPGSSIRNADEAAGPIDALRDMPLLVFKRATCLTTQAATLEGLLANDARFLDVAYALGLGAIGRQKWEEADTWLQKGYEWHPRWPALTLLIANVALTAEEFDRGLDFYDKTLELEPHAVDALIGKVRALTYLGRHEEAIAAVDRLLGERWYLGDARYWRAYNEFQLERYDEAWSDIEQSARLLVNAAVPKLAGLIALRRRELDVALAKFEESLQREPKDCQTNFYLGVVVAEQKNWTRAASIFPGTIACLDSEIAALTGEIERIRRSEDPPGRQARQIVARERRIEASRRLIATSNFNASVAYFNLRRDTEARPFAERVAADDQFGERARELLSRLK